MKKLQSKAWLNFYLLIGLGSVLLGVNVYEKYIELLNNAKHEQLYISKIVDADISTKFTKYETMIDLVGEGIIRNQNVNQSILDSILNRSNLLVGFAFFEADGSLHTQSTNLPEHYNYDITPDKAIYNWFQGALLYDSMRLNAPSYSDSLGRWILPIYKRLVDEDGQVLGVIISAIDIARLASEWPKSKAFGNNIELMLDRSFYQILNTGVDIKDYDDIFNMPLTVNEISSLKVSLAKEAHSFEVLRISNRIAAIMIEDDDANILHTIAYNNKYAYWTITSRPVHDFTPTLLQTTLYYVLFYLSLVAIAFLLFRRIVTTEQSKYNELTHRSEHDELTGCYNRTVLERFVLALTNYQKPFSLLYIDLDNFKNINDSFGHQYGDFLLVDVSKRLQLSLNSLSGTLIRYSGDQFLILLEHSSKNVIHNYTATLLADLAKVHLIHNNAFSVTCSIGIATYPEDSSNIHTLLSYAENSMLMAKKVKNQYLFFSQDVHQKLLKQARIEQALHLAIDANEISIVYQPQVDQQHELYGVEALVRWNSKELGFIPPDVFIQLAEETGFMPRLGQYIMDQAMSEVGTLQKQLDISFSLSINVSVRQFVQVNFFQSLMYCISQFGRPSLPITIEITESLFIESIEVLKPIFQKMKDNNISLALDDFGTGYSSLSMLREIPVDELKVDKSFVDHITNNDTDRAMVESIINMGKNLNMRVLAEGIEDIEQANVLLNAGCDLFQGYYFAKPLSINDLKSYCIGARDKKVLSLL